MHALPRRTRGLVAIVALTLALAGCKSEKTTTTSTAAAAPPAEVAAAPITQTAWEPDALEELVAPIALYPDLLVGQILAASVNAQEVLDAGNWLLENQELKGEALDAAAQKLGFGEATRALVQFPTVVDMMCQEIDWTRQLGAAFTSDQQGVLDAIQRLRTSAVNVGNLKDSPQQTVETRSENGKTYVVVEPADPKVVYVPQYDPAVVYTTPPTTTVVESSSGVSTGGVLLAFGIGIAVGAAINNNYYPYPHWGYGAVYMGARPFYPPAYAYRPVYGAAFRPAYAYRPPVNYHNSYNRNTNVNVNINNNYNNRFDGNANMKGNGSRSPIAGNTKSGASNRPQAGTSDWKGKSNYAGAKPGNTSKAKAGTKAARPANVDRGYGGTSGTRTAASTRPSASTGAVSSTRASASTGAATPRAAASPDAGGGARANVISGSGGYKHTVDANTGANVVSSTRSRSSGSSASTSSVGGSDAFSRSGSGSFDRAASARGQASTSSSYRGGGSTRGGGGGGGRR